MSEEEEHRQILKQFELSDEDIDFLISFAKTVDKLIDCKIEEKKRTESTIATRDDDQTSKGD